MKNYENQSKKGVGLFPKRKKKINGGNISKLGLLARRLIVKRETAQTREKKKLKNK